MFLSAQDLTARYSTSLQALREIAEAYYFQGRLDDAFHLWRTGEQLLTTPEVGSTDKMKFLLRYGRFLVQYYFLMNSEEALMVSIVQQARQKFEAARTQAQQLNIAFAIAAVNEQLQLLDGTE